MTFVLPYRDSGMILPFLTIYKKVGEFKKLYLLVVNGVR
jgi:hypothetical protein